MTSREYAYLDVQSKTVAVISESIKTEDELRVFLMDFAKDCLGYKPGPVEKVLLALAAFGGASLLHNGGMGK